MSDTFYSMSKGDVFSLREDAVTVGSSTASGSKVELRITDGALSAEQAYEFCEKMADIFGSKNPIVIAAGTLV